VKRFMIVILILAGCVVVMISGVGAAGTKSTWEYDILSLQPGEVPAQVMSEAGSQGWEAFFIREVAYGEIEVWMKRPQ